MNCKNLRETLSAFIDNETTLQEKNEIEQHLQICKKCSFIFIIEKSTKNNLREKLHISTPWKTRANIIETLRGETKFQIKKVYFDLPFLKPALAFGCGISIIVIFILFFLNQTQKEKVELSSNNLELQHIQTNTVQEKTSFEKSLSDFDMFLQGKKINTNAEIQNAKMFFANEMDIPIKIPNNKKCKMIGIDIKETEHNKIGQIFFTQNGKVFSLFQTIIHKDMCCNLIDSSTLNCKKNITNNNNTHCTISWIENDILFQVIGENDTEGFMDEMLENLKEENSTEKK